MYPPTVQHESKIKRNGFASYAPNTKKYLFITNSQKHVRSISTKIVENFFFKEVEANISIGSKKVSDKRENIFGYVARDHCHAKQNT